jgi:hypothetical protein
MQAGKQTAASQQNTLSQHKSLQFYQTQCCCGRMRAYDLSSRGRERERDNDFALVLGQSSFDLQGLSRPPPLFPPRACWLAALFCVVFAVGLRMNDH